MKFVVRLRIEGVLNIEQLIQSGGLLLIGAIVFAESGLLIGFFLPGDTLLLSAGVFAAQDKLPLGFFVCNCCLGSYTR